MSKEKQGSGGFIIETEDSGLKTMAFGWGAIILGVGIAVSAIILSSYLGVALTVIAGGLGIAFTAIGIGEGVRRARYGEAAKIEAKARMIEARHNKQLPPPDWR